MLAIDCGNSRIKWARFAAGRMIDRGSTSLLDDEQPLRVLGAALVPGIERVLVANVAGQAMAERLRAAVIDQLGLLPEFVAVEASAHGIECAYRDPATLGVDRWLAMIAGRSRVDDAFAVVSAGTAVTLDAVAASGRHLGGLILPGDRLMIESLAANTRQIGIVTPAQRPVRGIAMFGRSTSEAVAHGTQLAIAAAIDRAVTVFGAELGHTPRLLLTGGDAENLAGWLATPAEIRADLVLAGLAQVAAARE
jgi:type III pantothenate kinase